MNIETKLSAYYQKNTIEAGCDEAGRGCLAGPVVAAAVILPIDYYNPQLNDSKKLSEKTRRLLRDDILEKSLAHHIAFVWPDEIDKINILNASFLAMHRAIDNLVIQPESLLIDGNRFNPYPGVPHTCIIKGDGKFLSIAAASILAKTARDEYMEQLHQDYPMYNWKKNKGYPTKDHRAAIKEFGANQHHRHTFTLLPPEQLNLFD